MEKYKPFRDTTYGESSYEEGDVAVMDRPTKKYGLEKAKSSSKKGLAKKVEPLDEPMPKEQMGACCPCPPPVSAGPLLIFGPLE